MAQGLVSGVAAGVIVAGVGLVAASLVLPVSQVPAPEAVLAVQPAPPAPPSGRTAPRPAMPAPDLPAADLPATESPPAAPDRAPDLAQAPAEPANTPPAEAVPLPAGSEFARPGPEAPPSVAETTPPPQDAGQSPDAPRIAAAPEAQPPAPVTAPPPRPETATAPPVAMAAPETAQAALETPPGADPAIPVPPPGEARAPDLPPVPDLSPVPDLPNPPQTAGQAGANPAPDLASAATEITLMPDGTLVPPPAAPAPRVFVAGEGRGFTDAKGVTLDRLPQIGAAPADTAPVPAPVPVPVLPGTEAALTPEAPSNAPALERFAAPYLETPGLPWFSVVLVDVGTGAGGLDRDTLMALGPWVTVALDPSAPDAAEAARAYRAAGFEVAILADPLPQGATPQDVEVAMAAWQAAVPQALALVEPERPVLQASARLAEQAQKVLEAEGMAYVTQAQGMGAARRGGARATVWRVLDTPRDKAAVIMRMLGRAAFEANRDGAVVVMLSAWPESVAGLQAWRAEAGNGLNLAPLSATLRATAQP